MRLGKKYRLPPAEEERWRHLVMLECLNRATPKQVAELEKLQRKRGRLLNKHPKMIESNRRARNAIRRMDRKLAKALLALKKLKLPVDDGSV